MKSINILSLFIVLLSYFSRAEVIKFNDLNFDNAVAQGEWIVYFYADWCGHCNRFAPVFEDIEVLATEKKLDMGFGKINIDENPQLASRFYITSLPTLFHIKDKQVRRFNIPRTTERIMEFIDNKEWQEIKPRGFFTSPFSVVGRWIGYTSVIGAFMTGTLKWLQQYIK
ncbi:thioredoxin-like protein [Anaeromyces robustus]|uniref:Thioredoxin-like protein n=1 Tax=Anaeromyces robustus TaxID=1754192 RepID=A0A1Y1XMN5_9FUNG|nr:thioredoxin-like protein [Anaeromyces robustus]|eukprot:ORX86963.1 thioredoxin-like protein [Anaeromyces robustus]